MGDHIINSDVLEAASLGIEFGSTRIKAVLATVDGTVLATGGYGWENSYQNGIWTYDMDEIIHGLQSCYADLAKKVEESCGCPLTKVKAIGISAMMHGYLVIDRDGNLLAPFRTWRNVNAEKAADQLTELFGYNIPVRWSIAQLYESVLEHMDHVGKIDYLGTLAAYIHYRLTGRRVLGIGDASGMFPIDSDQHDYNEDMISRFDELVSAEKYPWKIRDILPKVLVAGEEAGTLTKEGASLLDPSGKLEAGIPLCPPEGDAGTGMVATNSVAVRTGNVSAGTSVFAMVVLEKALSKLYREIDNVTTPTGHPVAMVHANNCTSDINAWVGLFKEFADCIGADADMGKLFTLLFQKSMEGDPDCGKLASICYLSGEYITHIEEGRPMFVRTPDSSFTLANFMKAHIYSALGALHIGMQTLFVDEKVRLDRLLGHGGFFKTPGVGAKAMADACNTPVTCMETAGEGGAWGIAVLAAYLDIAKQGMSLEDYLSDRIFATQPSTTVEPTPEGVKGFEDFIKNYKACLPAEKSAGEMLKD